MKALRIVAAVVVAGCLMSGCSSTAATDNATTSVVPDTLANSAQAAPVTPTSTTSNSPTPISEPPTSEAPTSAPIAPMGSVGGDGKLSHGAAAAPLNVGGTFYTRDMYNNFAVTVVYETTKNEDMALLETLDSAGAPLGYQYGRDVCDAVREGKMTLTTMADNLHSNTGLTLGGAQAVIAGAARHLCDNAAIRGYLTYFDSQVSNEQVQIHKITHGWVELSVVGWSSRVTCDYLSYYGQSAGLRPALAAFMPYGTQTMVMPFPIKDNAGLYTASFDAVITTVASFWCPIDADLLGSTYYHS